MQNDVTNPPRATIARLAVRGLAALLLLLVGADHYYEYAIDHYSVVPTIGTLFLLNFISATAVGLVLLAPLRRIFLRTHALVLQVAAISGFGIAITSLVALLVSEQTKLFGFMEYNYRPAIVVAIALEASAALFLALLVALNWTAARSVGRGTRPPRADHGATLTVGRSPGG